MAELLGIRQDSISKLEKRTDLLLSTLRGYLNAMGGELELVVKFDDRPPLVITGLAELDDKDMNKLPEFNGSINWVFMRSLSYNRKKMTKVFYARTQILHSLQC
jgi:hypothetical protein